MKHLNQYIGHLINTIALNKKSFTLYLILQAIVVLTLIRSILTQNYEGAGICVLTLILFLAPAFFEQTFKIEIPPLFEWIIYLFIFSAEILGEVNHYYVLIPGWDTMLHTMNGFLCAAIGFSLVDLLNRKSKRVNLSPFFLTLVAFCFSMTIGVLWEFFEFTMDHFFLMDMQKDFIVTQFGSVTLDPKNQGTVIRVRHIIDTIIHTASGKTYTIKGGYLDIGINDTMKDLMVNFVGAISFSIIGYLYVSHRAKKGASRVVTNLMVTALDDEQLAAREAQIQKNLDEVQEEREKRKQEREEKKLVRAEERQAREQQMEEERKEIKRDIDEKRAHMKTRL